MQEFKTTLANDIEVADAKAQYDAEVKKIKDMFCYEGLSETKAGEEMIGICPAKAISPVGISREKCLAYCEEHNKRIPDPGLCGMCFRFKQMR